MEKICVVCEYGWILIGKKISEDAKRINLSDASIVRRWDNGRGIGGIAKVKYKDEYTLDYIGDVEILESKVLFVIPCEW